MPATDGKATLLEMVPAETEVNVPILVGVVKAPVLFESCAVNTLPDVKVPVIVYGILIPVCPAQNELVEIFPVVMVLLFAGEIAREVV